MRKLWIVASFGIYFLSIGCSVEIIEDRSKKSEEKQSKKDAAVVVKPNNEYKKGVLSLTFPNVEGLETATDVYVTITKSQDIKTKPLLTTSAKKQLIQQGIHPFSQQDWLNLTNNFAYSPLLQKAQQKVSQYLAIEAEKIPKNQAFLATSDTIESIFGKYKIFASSSPNSEIAVPGWGEYFARVYLLRPKIKCNSPHPRPSEVSYGERAPRQ